jgi:hypothetical protein
MILFSFAEYPVACHRDKGKRRIISPKLVFHERRRM